MLPLQPEQLPDPQSGHGEKLDQQPPLLRHFAQQGTKLVLGQRLCLFLAIVIVGPCFRDADPARRIAADQFVLERIGEHRP